MTRGLGFRSLATSLFAVTVAIWTVPSEAIVVPIDQFSVTRNGVDFFTDNFSDGLEPPIGPSRTTSYGLFGSISTTAESSGQLLLDSATGGASANAASDPRLTVIVTLLSDTSTNLSLGLKSDDTLLLTGTFGLTVPAGPLFSAYGVRFIDASSQTVQLMVRFLPAAGQTEIAYILQDFDAGTINTLGNTPLAPPAGADRISLSISRPNVGSPDFLGSFSYLSGSAVVGTGVFNVPGQMFQGEEFVRAQFFAAEGVAVAPIPEPETYAMMLAGLAVLGAAARRRKEISSSGD
jgi:hypothetical protein